MASKPDRTSSSVKSSTIWISYDLGVRGDYEGLYRWLDNHSAQECGDALAVLLFQWRTDLLADLKFDMKNEVKFDKRSRVYVIYRDRDTNKNKGKFLVGGRKAAAWTGYAQTSEGDTDEEN